MGEASAGAGARPAGSRHRIARGDRHGVVDRGGHSDFALDPVSLPTFARPDFTDFLWTIPLAIAIAVGAFVILRLARLLLRLVESREFLLLPLAGLAVSGLAIAFSEAADKSVNAVLFSGEIALPSLVANPGAWSLSALALLIAFKGVAWAISLAGFRGGPVFPALFLGSAAGMMAAHLPGFEITPAVAVGMGAAIAAVLQLPLTAVVLAALLTANSGAGASPVIIVGVVVAYVTSRVLTERFSETVGGRRACLRPGELNGGPSGGSPERPCARATRRIWSPLSGFSAWSSSA